MTQFQNDRRPNSSRPTLRRPHKSRPWSHQDELKGLIGKQIRMISNNGGTLTGTLLAADAFTIKIGIDDKSAFTYFKHTIAGYGVA